MNEFKRDTANSLSGELIHIRDVNSHDIFKNNILTSQFLRDYTWIRCNLGLADENKCS